MRKEALGIASTTPGNRVFLQPCASLPCLFAQGSSIGTPTLDLLLTHYASANGLHELDCGVARERMKRLSASARQLAAAVPTAVRSPPSPITVVFPSRHAVASSLLGFPGSGHLCLDRRTLAKPQFARWAFAQYAVAPCYANARRGVTPHSKVMLPRGTAGGAAAATSPEQLDRVSPRPSRLAYSATAAFFSASLKQ